MTPLAVSMIVSQRFVAAFVIFVAAGISDGVDGFLAKRFDLRSELGAYLDPLADKALLISIYVTLAAVGKLPAALAILVVSRDLMILVAVLVSWLLKKPVEIRPVWISKFNTVAQIAFAAFVLGARAYGLDEPVVRGVSRARRRRLDVGVRRGLYRAMARSHEPLETDPRGPQPRRRRVFRARLR